MPGYVVALNTLTTFHVDEHVMCADNALLARLMTGVYDYSRCHYSMDRSRVAMSDSSLGVVKVFDTTTWEAKSISFPDGVVAVALSPNGAKLAATLYSPDRLVLFDVATGAIDWQLTSAEIADPVNAVCFNSDGTVIAVGSSSGPTITTVNVSAGTVIDSETCWTDTSDFPMLLEYMSSDSVIVANRNSGELVFLSAFTLQMTSANSQLYQGPPVLEISSDRTKVAVAGSASGDFKLMVYDSAGTVLANKTTGYPQALCFTENGEQFVFVDSNNVIVYETDGWTMESTTSKDDLDIANPPSYSGRMVHIPVDHSVSNINGAPVSDASSMPLEGCKVHVIARQTGDLIGSTETDEFGEFSMGPLLFGGEKCVIFLAPDDGPVYNDIIVGRVE